MSSSSSEGLSAELRVRDDDDEQEVVRSEGSSEVARTPLWGRRPGPSAPSRADTFDICCRRIGETDFLRLVTIWQKREGERENKTVGA